MTYKFKYKCGRFYKSVSVIGHKYNKELDRMILMFKDGGIMEIASWSCYDCKLGKDWALAVKKEMEKQAGQSIPVDRDLDAK